MRTLLASLNIQPESSLTELLLNPYTNIIETRWRDSQIFEAKRAFWNLQKAKREILITELCN